MKLVALLALVACGSGVPAPAPEVRVVVMRTIAPPPPPKPAPPARIVELVKTTSLHAAPSAGANVVGIIRHGTRVAIAAELDAADCHWIELAPRGWTCDDAVEPTPQAPTPTDAPALDDDDEPQPIHGVYGYVRGDHTAYATVDDARAGTGYVLGGSTTVRGVGVVRVDGKRFWRTSQGQLVDEDSIGQLAPSRFKGVALHDGDAMPAWVHARRDSYKPADLRAEPSARAKVVATLAPRAVVTIRETSSDGAFVRIDDAHWIARADVRVAALAPPPPDIAGDEKWFDVDRDEQVLVAYEGTRAVYATLVSTGGYEHETPTETARIASKHESAVMSSDTTSVYSVADVPWTMYYDRDFALHTAYWHDGFGSRRSHGCINLSPRDARLLYYWSSPDVPPGWTTVYGNADAPGSLVRVRSSRDPEPAMRGYARTLVAART
jgi:hypothetical protein